MVRMEQLCTKIDNKKIVVVVGRICSGKSVFSQILAKNLELRGRVVKIVDIGDLVREIVNKEERVFKSQLDLKIIERLSSIINSSREDEVVIVVGPRQVSITNSLEGEKTQFLYLECSEQERRRRYLSRNADKDKDLSFEEVEQRENELGMQTVIETILNSENHTIVKIEE